MADRQELAGDLRDCLAPGETIVWRSVQATIKHWQFSLVLAMTVFATLLLLALLLQPLGMFDWPYHTLWLIGASSVMAICGLLFLVYAGHSAVVLTQSNLYARTVVPNAPIRRIAREDMVDATVYVSDGTVLLAMTAGHVERLRCVANVRELVAEMAVPAQIWAAHEGPGSGGMIALILLGITGGLAQTLGGYAFDLVTDGELPSRWYIIPMLIGAAFALNVLGHWFKARKMSAEERRQAACILLDPSWRGCDPYSLGTIPLWKLPRATVALWTVKSIYGMPTECATGHDPEVIDPRQTAAAE